MGKTSVRYIVTNVDAAVPFWERLEFKVEMQPAPGGCNRFQIPVQDLDAAMKELRDAGTHISHRHRAGQRRTSGSHR